MKRAISINLAVLIRQVALLVAAFVMSTSLAFAHAALNQTSPADGAMVDTAPASLTLSFSEPVSPLALNLIGPDGSATPLTDFTISDRMVEIAAPSDLSRGTHVLTWRVVSADGHPVGGSVVFSIGEVSSAPLVEEPVDWLVRGGVWLSKVGLYVGLFIGVGGAFARAVLLGGATAGRRPVLAALLVGLVSAIASLPFQGLDALGAQAGRMFDPLIWSTGFGTSYGKTVVAALAALLLGLASSGLGGLSARIVSSSALLVAAAAPALSGHASAADPQGLMRPAVSLHVLAIAAWIGALVPLGLALRRGEAGATTALLRFSRAMPWVLAVLVVAGTALAVVQVETPSALLTTAYGRVFLAKIALLALLFALAAHNRWKLTAPAMAGEATARRGLVRAIAVETLVALLVFGLAATWRFTPPPRAIALAAAQPATMHIHTDRAMADVTVTPGRVGSIDVSAVLMTGEFGPLDAKEVTFVLSNPAAGIEPFERRAEKPGDGTWRANGVMLPLAGTWTLRIDILISDFEIARIEGSVEIRP